MKRIKAILTASAMTLTALVSAGWYAPPLETVAADQVNIMPIGDSITFGYGPGMDGGYRKFLDQALKSKGIEFDMVGPEGANSATFNYNGQTVEYDNNHAGYSGFTIKQQYPIPSWGENGLLEKLQSKDAVKNAQPDIVLLIIGTNDMTANRDLTACEQDLHTLVDYILENMPEGGVVFMGSIPDFTAYGGNETRVKNYNAVVRKVAESYDDNVQFADVHSCLGGMAHMQSDNLHPDATGYELMGKYWAEVIEEYLDTQSDPDAPENPEILHSDFENGISGWKPRGTATVDTTTSEHAEGSAAASVSSRGADWAGIAYSLSSKRCPEGTHLSISAKIKQNSGSPVHFKMTMQYDDGVTAVYDTFAEADAETGEWITLSCPDYVMKSGSSPLLYFETDGDKCDFFLDEVLVMKTDGTVPTEPTEPEPSETEPEPSETEPEPSETQPVLKVAGDVTGDGVLDTRDVVALQRWLLADPEIRLADYQAADLYPDGVIDIFDLGIMKRMLFEK